MKSIFLVLSALYLISLCSISCSSEEEKEVCVSFDQKQCNIDPWTKDNQSKSIVSRVESYLLSENIKVQKIVIDETYHNIVCAACEVCPDGPRIFLKTTEEGSERIQKLNLLQLAIEDCSEIF